MIEQLPTSIHLIDKNAELVKYWSEAFAGIENVQASNIDYFSEPVDAIISPANSFGIMDGGIDLAIRNTVGFKAEENLRKAILKDHHGELPVGSAIIVPTENVKWPYLVSAPTMRIPSDVSSSLNAYLAFRAILNVIKNFNESSINHKIKSISCCGLATGIGKMKARKCAGQMRAAYTYMYKQPRIPSFNEIHEVHRKLVSL